MSIVDRRDFLCRLGAGTAVLSAGAFRSPLDAEELRSTEQAVSQGVWDMSWVDKIQRAQYKSVFDSPALADGAAIDLASGIWNDFKAVYGSDEVARMVIIMRQLGQVMGFNDTLWEKYAIGEERKVNDPATKLPAKRNPWAHELDTLRARGAIFLVCNRASMNWANGTAERMKLDIEEVKNDVRNNLVPGAILMPTGVFALVRAQNSGCAYMRGA
jgi:intracellular sulfur oxidation DsrE/DsrF family protein